MLPAPLTLLAAACLAGEVSTGAGAAGRDDGLWQIAAKVQQRMGHDEKSLISVENVFCERLLWSTNVPPSVHLCSLKLK
ncbi:hypothetical protein E2C01_019441 [Portunus trituberculatus]|uniref:Uncharacterized protein n=1 Tax=Portunus trituberculatus TaxID=210409 RepID=A0A5B7DY97_PORTR|nr:hypothetical protein [Portunus trituberculatus]